MGVVPRSDLLAVKRGEDVYKGLLVLPENVDEKSTWGTVRYVGKDWKDEFPVGEIVIFKRDSGTEYDIDGERLLIINGDDVLAIYER